MDSFTGKKALVIGGSGGIGAALSLLLAESGTALTVHAGHESEKFNALLAKLRSVSHGAPVTPIVQQFSCGAFAALPHTPLAATARESDIVCVCYGPFLQKPLHDMTAQEWQEIAALDYALPGYFVTEALCGMKARGWGRILLFGGTGTVSRSEFRTNAAYAGAKTAVGTLVQSAAAAYARFGITCNAVLPGFTQTEYTERQAAALARKMPLGTLITAESAARTSLSLLQNPDANGVLFRLDRGWSPAFE